MIDHRSSVRVGWPSGPDLLPRSEPRGEQTRRMLYAGRTGTRFDDDLPGGGGGGSAGVPARQSDLVLCVAARDAADRGARSLLGAGSDRDGRVRQAAGAVPIRRPRSLPGRVVRRARPRQGCAGRPRLGRGPRLRLGRPPPGTDARRGVHGDDRAAHCAGTICRRRPARCSSRSVPPASARA